ncbi:hypothetical protein ColTof3_13899 [Colletotrichum tofieldiae]|nr:hypothetical protein ColTof3_13899 [Colletotrichum tofieldiae]GKT95208.1 hypothetical protein Ct61P_13058 [Colletotrichum tofieldiae]
MTGCDAKDHNNSNANSAPKTRAPISWKQSDTGTMRALLVGTTTSTYYLRRSCVTSPGVGPYIESNDAAAAGPNGIHRVTNPLDRGAAADDGRCQLTRNLGSPSGFIHSNHGFEHIDTLEHNRMTD